jgi:hypothetical protein
MSSLPFSSVRVAGVKEVILHGFLANLGVRKFSCPPFHILYSRIFRLERAVASV